jgi:quinol monooxygenase YgiN
MINVIASLCIKEGSLSEFIEICKANAMKVREEKGCIEYFPLIDIDAKLPTQGLDENAVIIIEKWENIESLHDHLKATHMLVYREKVKDMIIGRSLKVLTAA